MYIDKTGIYKSHKNVYNIWTTHQLSYERLEQDIKTCLSTRLSLKIKNKKYTTDNNKDGHQKGNKK